jgi:hypothetical protein
MEAKTYDRRLGQILEERITSLIGGMYATVSGKTMTPTKVLVLNGLE